VENGLIDEMGDLTRAVELAKELAGIPAEEQVTLAHFPAKQGLLEGLMGGNQAVSTAARWAVFRMIRKDVAETLEIIEQRPDLATGDLAP
jgi:protease-4